jgi:hypothetical protein
VSPNVTQTALTTVQQRAALLVAEDAQTDEQIASECGVTKRTLERWKKIASFIAAVEAHKTRWRAEIDAQGIANRQNRVDALQDRWERMRAVIEARAEEHADVPGGKTGLLVRQIKSVGFGQNNQTVEEYAVDTALLKELRAHEQQAAQELGQWLDKHEHTGKDGESLVFTIQIDRPDDDSDSNAV